MNARTLNAGNGTKTFLRNSSMTRPWGLPMRHKNSRTTQTFRLCRPGICICGNFRIKNGDSETRTRDLYVANVSLSQLSYIPMQIIISLSIEYARFKILQIQKNFSFFSLHSRWGYAIIIFVVGVWRSLVARSAGGREVAGSNPVTPILSRNRKILFRFFYLLTSAWNQTIL